MSQIPDTPITEDAWRGARPGYILKDTNGVRWTITENRGEQDGGWSLMLQHPDDEHPEEYIMTFQFKGRHVVETEEWGIMMEFNGPGAEIVSS